MELAPTLDRLRAAFLREAIPTAQRRRELLARLREGLLERQDAIAAAISADFSQRARQETQAADLFPTIAAIDHMSRHLGRWMKPESRLVRQLFRPGQAWVEYQPLGVVGIIAPWNYPLSLALIPLATALAAGNRVMLKPSEYTPATSALMAEMLGKLYADDQVAVIQGDAAVGAAFAALPFDLLCFTGSTTVGRSVMRAASDHLVPVLLELGGKSPAIIDSGYSLDKAARSIAFGKLLNAGQTCVAPDYVLVPEKDAQAFVDKYIARANAMYPEWWNNPHYSAVISQKHLDRLWKLVDDALTKGAKILEVGAKPAAAGRGSRKFPPTVLKKVTDEMTVMQDEIFGPILPVRTYRTLEEVISYINLHPRPLALYYFGRDRQRQRDVLAHTVSGGVTINDVHMHYLQDSLPFGGVGASGMGRYHGIEGFHQFSHQKAIYRQARFHGVSLLHPPYGKVFDFVLRRLLKPKAKKKGHG
ncbi:MAG TPA: coniferyl aldehyde dehydrogenase [Gemmatimonadales bacterium]|nr:coniferyl aldehyde dehydrogenase [Gemmatimonadales bacterium]